ncbi:hypothetical protein [Pseudomonas syringae]|uniref:hypothetical protein n=1 Tax=Pseudomonas syringae TaxID=317 RepID=UPI0003450FB0|nr:hypothetical protein [Pseudomonas syringae]NAT17175.1 hypothetical protein [Pseudomonas syringae pv. actinidifoliorum]NAT60721.1 hypothetical protein [Pseudomonas syringae pv. actinidifoliorum]OOK99812.1 hypothetical protein B0B36_03505 [Pseudomonas syringae pv. actinidifoliorum]
MYLIAGEGTLRGRFARTSRPSVRIALARSVSEEGTGAAAAVLAILDAGSKAAATAPAAE